jgi:hypothetical protein
VLVLRDGYSNAGSRISFLDGEYGASAGGENLPRGGWGYFDFNHFEPKAPTAKVKANEECAFCHIASAKKDEVWTQFYRLLDK